MRFVEFPCLCNSFVYLDLLCCSLPTTVSVISDHLLLEVCGIYWKKSQNQHGIHFLWVSVESLTYGYSHSWTMMWNNLACDWICKYFAELDTIFSEKLFWEKSWNEHYLQKEAHHQLFQENKDSSFTVDEDYILDTFICGLQDVLK